MAVVIDRDTATIRHLFLRFVHNASMVSKICIKPTDFEIKRGSVKMIFISVFYSVLYFAFLFLLVRETRFGADCAWEVAYAHVVAYAHA